MELIKPPEPLSLSGNLEAGWRLFKQKFDLYLMATASTDKASSVKCALLLTLAGDEAIEVYNNFTFQDGERKEDYATVVKKFEEYCAQQKNEIYERYIFRTRVQSEREPFEHFLRDLKKQARHCSFDTLETGTLRKTLAAARDAGLTFNPAKCKFGMKELLYLGNVISEDGVRPNPQLVSCFVKLPPPTDKQSAQRMLGVANYFGKYIPNLAERTALLRSLIKADTHFEWTTQHEREWNYLRQLLTRAPLLVFFNPKKPTKISSDASRNGLGTALLQLHGNDWLPVAYASRALSEAEQRYSQIEKETLGITFGCEKFHQFVYGRNITIETDHRPLLAIAGKGIGDMPPRLQRFFLRLCKYDYSLQFVPGKQLVLADMLSRSGSLESNGDFELGEDVEVHAINVLASLVSDSTREQLQQESVKDPELRSAIANLGEHVPLIGQLKSLEQELSVVDGILFKGARVVVPKNMRADILRRIHEGHLGINKCKERARRLVFWPGLNSDIDALIQRCAVCKKHAYRQPKEPLLMREPPHGPWRRVGIDIFQYAGNSYLCAYDAHSNFPEVEKLRNTTAETVIDCLRSVFARYGIPMEVLTDNGPQFASHQFTRFAMEYDFKHVTSSPGFPQSNGLAEKGVQVVKRILKKTMDAREDFWLGLLAYRSTPLQDGRSPAELLMGRCLRTRLPDFRNHPDVPVAKRKQLQHDRQTLSPLNEGDIVRMQGSKGWPTKAKVLGTVAPRSYRVQTEGQQVFRRNRQHLLPTGEVLTPQSGAWDTSSEMTGGETPDLPAAPVSSPSTSEQDSDVGPPLLPRRSDRTVRPPRRLHYDSDFEQVP